MIYLDHHAATPLAPGVDEALAEGARRWANPASVHSMGRRARAALELARERIAGAIGAKPTELVLTSGGTEACNLGTLGLGRQVKRIVTTVAEHPAVTTCIDLLGGRGGLEVVRVEMPGGVPPTPPAMAGLLDDRTLLAVQWVNHETGAILPIEAYARVARERGALVFCDGVQALGKLPVRVTDLGVHALALASHKMGGPAGAGALWVESGVSLSPQVVGGGQERGHRAGAPDLAALAGFGAACAQVPARCDGMAAVGALRDELEAALVELGATANRGDGRRVGTVTNVSVPRWRGAELVAALDVEGLCASSGAACSSGVADVSVVLAAMFRDEPWRAVSALRLSLGPETSVEEVEQAVQVLRQVLPRGEKSR